MDNAIAAVIITLWRVAPPRLLPTEYGYIDVLHPKNVVEDNIWQNNRFRLTIAAMPSLHFGTSLFLAIVLCRFSPHRVVRVLAPLWPMVMLYTILATANHFILDAVVGAAIPFIGWRYNELMNWALPIQNWLFWPLTRKMEFEAETDDEDDDHEMIKMVRD